MSSWIHANGIIVVRSFYEENDMIEKIKKNIRASLGAMIEFGEEEPEFAYRYMPSGSEGSFRYEIVENDCSIYISIKGDLRDMYPDDLQEIEDWYKESIKGIDNIDGCYLDAHVFTAYCEYGGRIVMYDDGLKVGVIKC